MRFAARPRRTAQYYRSLADYNIAVAEVHLARGSFLASHNVFLHEGACPVTPYPPQR